MYFKEQSGKQEKSFYLVNVPHFSNVQAHLGTNFGVVSKIEVEPVVATKLRNARVYQGSTWVQAPTEIDHKKLVKSLISAHIKQQLPVSSELQLHADHIMSLFEEKERQSNTDCGNVEDEDGFTLVSSSSKRKKRYSLTRIILFDRHVKKKQLFSRTCRELNPDMSLSAKKKKKKSLELKNFYRHQVCHLQSNFCLSSFKATSNATRFAKRRRTYLRICEINSKRIRKGSQDLRRPENSALFKIKSDLNAHLFQEVIVK